MIYARLCVCWHILIDGQSAVKIFLFVFFQAVFMQTLQLLLQPSFACSRFAKSHALQLGQVVIQREILFLLFSEVVIQREVVFYSFRMGSFNGGWCRYKKMHPSSHIAASLFQVTYI